MDARPKSNKIKRREKKRKLELRAERLEAQAARTASVERARGAQKALTAWRAVRQNPDTLIQQAAAGQPVEVPATSELHVIVKLFEEIKQRKARRFAQRPDVAALERLILVCRERSDLLAGREVSQYASALLALSAHSRQWLRPPEEWVPRSHNSYKQFHALVRHLTARYDVPTFMNTAWLEGLTRPGVVHQRWFIHVAQGQNIRTAAGLPIALTKKQAHLYIQAPDDFDVLSALRWAQLREMGGDERLIRSICASWVATNFVQDEFWLTVFRWLVDQPMLDAVHHGPIIDYLHEQRFVASVPNPRAGEQNQPRLIAPQPNLTMRRRQADTLLRSVRQWHRALGRAQTPESLVWEPTGIEPFLHEEGTAENRRVFVICELLSSRALNEEGLAMKHCVGSYASSCASGRVSIWSLRVTDAWGQNARLLTLEVCNESRQIVQARQRHNKYPTEKELSILQRWASAGGPTLSKWLTA